MMRTKVRLKAYPGSWNPRARLAAEFGGKRWEQRCLLLSRDANERRVQGGWRGGNGEYGVLSHDLKGGRSQ